MGEGSTSVTGLDRVEFHPVLPHFPGIFRWARQAIASSTSICGLHTNLKGTLAQVSTPPSIFFSFLFGFVVNTYTPFFFFVFLMLLVLLLPVVVIVHTVRDYVVKP